MATVWSSASTCPSRTRCRGRTVYGAREYAWRRVRICETVRTDAHTLCRPLPTRYHSSCHQRTSLGAPRELPEAVSRSLECTRRSISRGSRSRRVEDVPMHVSKACAWSIHEQSKVKRDNAPTTDLLRLSSPRRGRRLLHVALCERLGSNARTKRRDTERHAHSWRRRGSAGGEGRARHGSATAQRTTCHPHVVEDAGNARSACDVCVQPDVGARDVVRSGIVVQDARLLLGWSPDVRERTFDRRKAGRGRV